jgi:hypothetical protein
MNKPVASSYKAIFMMNLRIVLSVLFLACGFAPLVFAVELAKPKTLSSAEEKRWIDAVRNRETSDGATVLQVLQYAEKMRPKKFKIAAMEVGYNGASGEPQTVAAAYWIGAKRLPGDSFIDLYYDVQRIRGKLKVTAVRNEYIVDTINNAVEGGRDSFLIYIDKMYADTCIDFDTKQRLC